MRAPTIARLVKDGALQLSLFDEKDLAEIVSPDFPVAEMLAQVIEELGSRWERAAISTLQEHVAAARLARALARAADQLPTARTAPLVLLATPPGETHALGLALAELCFREAGFATVWAGTDVPLTDLERGLSERSVSVLALSASVVASPATLAETAARLGPACAAARVSLILGGKGAWPELTSGAERAVTVIRTWTGLRTWLQRGAFRLTSAAQ